MTVMEDMLKDFLLGEHLLLVGNQVGKTPQCHVVMYTDVFRDKAAVCIAFKTESNTKNTNGHYFNGDSCDKWKKKVLIVVELCRTFHFL